MRAMSQWEIVICDCSFSPTLKRITIADFYDTIWFRWEFCTLHLNELEKLAIIFSDYSCFTKLESDGTDGLGWFGNCYF